MDAEYPEKVEQDPRDVVVWRAFFNRTQPISMLCDRSNKNLYSGIQFLYMFKASVKSRVIGRKSIRASYLR
jgi:hypothetical protein